MLRATHGHMKDQRACHDNGSVRHPWLDQEVFAVPVELVREILDMRQPFRIPEAPAHLAGLIDVRGQAVPVIDLRLKLGLPPRDASADTRILVLDVPLEGRCLSLGLIADRVFEVTALIPAASPHPRHRHHVALRLHRGDRPPRRQLRRDLRSVAAAIQRGRGAAHAAPPRAAGPALSEA